jgi:hypothetical protein
MPADDEAIGSVETTKTTARLRFDQEAPLRAGD